MCLENPVSIGEKSKSLTDEERISAFNKNMISGGFLDRNAAKLENTGVIAGSWLTMRPVMLFSIIRSKFSY